MKNHKYFEELITLSFLGEISDEERDILESHLENCPECQEEFVSLKTMREVLGHRAAFSPSAELQRYLHDAVMEKARRERKTSILGFLNRLSERLYNWYESVFMRPAYVLGGAMGIFLLGILLGKLWLSSDILHDPEMLLEFAQEQRRLSRTEEEDLQKFLANYLIQEGNLQIEKLKPVGGKEDKVTVDFITGSDFQVSGDINDAPIQNVVLYSLMKDENPGVRLRAVRMLENAKANDRVREALNQVALNDANDGVRLRAVQILRKMPRNRETIQVFMKALIKDPNPRVRIEIVEAFKEWKDPSVRSALAIAASQDENAYIQKEARALLEELNNNNEKNGS